MGYGFMFGLAEESIPGHVGERAPRVREGDQLLPAGEADGSSGGGAALWLLARGLSYISALHLSKITCL